VRALKALLVAMATDRLPADIDVQDVGQPITLWREARFKLERTYRGRGLVGERYLLQNVSDTVMVLSEPEFDREDDAAGSVAGIAIEHHNLRPGERTQVFVIRREGRP
jgi:conjugal transfer pilus assembly protein TraK